MNDQPKFIEVNIELKPKSKPATCIGRNGVFPVATACLEDLGDGTARIGFVSKKLKRRVNAGAVIPVDVMDKLALEWLRIRGKERVPTCAHKFDLKVLSQNLSEIAQDLGVISEEM